MELPSGESACVEDREYMRAHHMELLDEWRTAVVREGSSTYVSKASGKSYPMSLTKTCMGCHTSREAFCDKCHEYESVSSLHVLSPCPQGTRHAPRDVLPLAEREEYARGIGCWDCHHVEPKGN